MVRFRRLRRDGRIRSLVRETRLHPGDFVYPLFVIEGEGIENPVESMPGVFQYSIDRLPGILEQVKEAGIGGILLFGIRPTRIPRAVRRMRRTESLSARWALSGRSTRKSM